MDWLVRDGLSLTAWSATLGGMAAGAAKLLGWSSSGRRSASIARDSFAHIAKQWVCTRAGIDPARITIAESFRIPGAAFEQNRQGGLLLLNPKLLNVMRGGPAWNDYAERQVAQFDAFLDEVPDQPEEIGPWMEALPSDVFEHQRRASKSWGWSLSLDEWKFLMAHELSGHAQHQDALLELGSRVVVGVGGMLAARILGAGLSPWAAELLQLGAWLAHELFASTLLSRWMERRADRAALSLGAQGGPHYFKRIMVQQIFEKMGAECSQAPTAWVEWVEVLESWTTTHPSLEERVRLLRAGQDSN